MVIDEKLLLLFSALFMAFSPFGASLLQYVRETRATQRQTVQAQATSEREELNIVLNQLRADYERVCGERDRYQKLWETCQKSGTTGNA